MTKVRKLIEFSDKIDKIHQVYDKNTKIHENRSILTHFYGLDQGLLGICHDMKPIKYVKKHLFSCLFM